MGRVTVAVLTWNSAELLPACIASVKQQTYALVELIVIDNASQDNSVAWIRRHHPSVRIIENPTNLGFAGAHNVGIRESRGESYLPLNPDVELTSTYVEKLINTVESDKACGMAQGKLLQWATSKDHPARLDSTGVILTKTRRNKDRGHGQVDGGQYDEPERIFGAGGAAPLYRREMLEDARIDREYFDEAFFAYREEVDLAWRAQWRGWHCRYVPSAVAYHARTYSPETRRSLPARLRKLQYRNRYLMLIKNASARNLLLHAPFILGTELLAFAYVIVAERELLACYANALRLLPAMLQKRRQIMACRRVSDLEMRRWFQ